MKTPIELITEERKRQIEKEGWTSEHDDEHANMSLAVAGASYVLDCASTHTGEHPNWKFHFKKAASKFWPFNREWFKPTPDDPIRQLTKAGALIVAEMERLHRMQKRK
jgi:hypothetical protein